MHLWSPTISAYYTVFVGFFLNLFIYFLNYVTNFKAKKGLQFLVKGLLQFKIGTKLFLKLT